MRTRLLVMAAVAALVAVFSPGPAQATHSWGGYHWARTANPFTLKVGDNVSSTWDSYLVNTVNDWTSSTVLNLSEVPGLSSSRNCKGTTGRVEVCNNTYGYNGWLGVASISITGGTHITKGTVKLNDSYFNTATYNRPEWRNMVTCQEVGHTLGLDHQDTNFDNDNLGTCMDYTSNPLGPPDNEQPNQHDYDELVTIYTHLDTSTTVAAATPASAASVGNDASTWGRQVEGSRKAGFSTYVRDFANGERVVTFVTWAR